MIVSPLLASSGGFWAPIANPLAAVLAFFYSLVPNYGIAIVLLTIAMMIVLTPLTIKQTRSMLVMQKLQPEMKKLQEQHKNDRQALNEAVMALYKEHNASPLGGCLPMLLPFPLFIGLLRVLEGLSHTVKDPKTHIVTAVPKYLTSHTLMYKDIVKAHGQLDAFGMNLAKSARNVGGGFAHTLPYFVLLLIMVGTQFYQQYQLTSKNPAAKSQPGQAMMMKFIPIFFGFISLNFPAGVVLYWTVSNIIRIGQQWALYRYDPKVKALVVKDIKEIEAKTREIDARDAKQKSTGLSRFRDLMSNASEAAADRKGLGGKNAAKPGAKPAGDKPGAAGRGGRTPPGKGTGGNAGVNKSQRPGGGGSAGAKAGGTQKATTPKPGAPRPGAPPKPGAPRPATSKTTPIKPGAAKPGVAKPGGAKPGVPKAGDATGGTRGGGGGAAASAGGSQKAGASKPTDDSPTTRLKPAASQPPLGGPSVPAKAPTPANGTNGGAGQVAGTTKNGNGAGAETAPEPAPGPLPAPTGNGGAANGGGGAAKGRTGGGSARNVSSRRRRKGR